jgi:hypothetical protein
MHGLPALHPESNSERTAPKLLEIFRLTMQKDSALLSGMRGLFLNECVLPVQRIKPHVNCPERFLPICGLRGRPLPECGLPGAARRINSVCGLPTTVGTNMRTARRTI